MQYTVFSWSNDFGKDPYHQYETAAEARLEFQPYDTSTVMTIQILVSTWVWLTT